MPLAPRNSATGRKDATALTVATLVVLVLIIITVIIVFAESPRKDKYSVGYQIGPHYLGSSSWDGIPYVMTQEKPRGKDTFQPFAPPDEGPRGTTHPPKLIYTPAFTSDLRGKHPNWWRPDGGTYGLPPASERPDFWAGDMTIHTYLARNPIPPLCALSEVASGARRLTPEEWTKTWQYYGGPKGWNMSPYY
jgi:hypothetical protein